MLMIEEVIFNSDCPVCLSKHNASLEKRVVVGAKYLIINLKRYLLNDGGWVNDMSLVNCVMEQLSFSVDIDDEVQYTAGVLLCVWDITKLSGYPRSNVNTRLEQSNLFLASGRFPLQKLILSHNFVGEYFTGNGAFENFYCSLKVCKHVPLVCSGLSFCHINCTNFNFSCKVVMFRFQMVINFLTRSLL